MKNKNILKGLYRASWLFSLVGFILTAFFIIDDSYIDWDEPHGYFGGAVIGAVTSFLLFRIGIWVYKGFVDADDAKGR
jgi:hypothetical protein